MNGGGGEREDKKADWVGIDEPLTSCCFTSAIVGAADDDADDDEAAGVDADIMREPLNCLYSQRRRRWPHLPRYTHRQTQTSNHHSRREAQRGAEQSNESERGVACASIRTRRKGNS